MSGWTIVAIGGTWLLVGLVLSLLMGRRGHDAFGWWVLGAVLGPLAVVLAADAVHHEGESRAQARVVASGVPGGGSVDVLVGVDGSPEAAEALEAALDLLGSRVGRLTLAAVVGHDAPRTAGGGEEERRLRAELERMAVVARAKNPARELRSAPEREPELEVLVGRPADCLRRLAEEGGYELLVVGARGAGLSRAWIGSVASQLAGRGAKVPVLLAGGRR